MSEHSYLGYDLILILLENIGPDPGCLGWKKGPNETSYTSHVQYGSIKDWYSCVSAKGAPLDYWNTSSWVLYLFVFIQGAIPGTNVDLCAWFVYKINFVFSVCCLIPTKSILRTQQYVCPLDHTCHVLKFCPWGWSFSLLWGNEYTFIVLKEQKRDLVLSVGMSCFNCAQVVAKIAPELVIKIQE